MFEIPSDPFWIIATGVVIGVSFVMARLAVEGLGWLVIAGWEAAVDAKDALADRVRDWRRRIDG